MWFLFFQIWIWLILAFILGWYSHWFFCCRLKKSTADRKQGVLPTIIEADPQETPISEFEQQLSQDDSISENWKPMLFSEAPAQVDDLKQIKGIGEVLEDTLHSLGVYQFDQIAEWTDEHVAWMDNFLSFAGRIDREDWRTQAKTLVAARSS